MILYFRKLEHQFYINKQDYNVKWPMSSSGRLSAEMMMMNQDLVLLLFILCLLTNYEPKYVL